MSSTPEPQFNSSDVVIFLTVCFFFTLEAILHYSIGKTGNFSLVFPPFKDFIKIVTVVVVFSFLSTVVQNMIVNYFEEK